MNKVEKLICVLLGGVLAWYIFTQMPKQNGQQQAQPSLEQTMAQDRPSEAVSSSSSVVKEEEKTLAKPAVEVPAVPEQIVVLENDLVKVELSSWGAVVKKVTLKNYARNCGEVSESNPAVEFDFCDSPLGALIGVPGLGANAAYVVSDKSDSEVSFSNGLVTRKISMSDGYRIVYDEKFANGGDSAVSNSLSLGMVRMGDSKNDLLSVDSMAVDAGKGKSGVIHHCEGDSPLKAYLVGGLSGGCSGCSGSKSAAGMPLSTKVSYPGCQTWIAVKNRFFVTAMCSSTEPTAGFEAEVKRDASSSVYRPGSVSASALFAKMPAERKTVFYVGPKKQSLLWDMGMRDVMEFGMWRWLCYPIVWVLNFFNDWIPNYGVAIILMTILVRLLFWPLTHKSTIGMKKMQELQPKMKELQAKFKDNPQRLQQETWAMYREAKVNPMSSCLPMLIQIPVFIALFNVLRSAVELRYAGFLWISDLSEPEALFADWFPFGGLNILPVLMAATMALQSALTPSAGDKNQQKMMMIFMPVMMLFMFYSFPSALSLYWTLSQVLSIWQMWLIRRKTAKEQKVLIPEVIDPPTTRQMRRHG